MFIVDGIDEPREIPSMPGVYQHTFDSLKRAPFKFKRPSSVYTPPRRPRRVGATQSKGARFKRDFAGIDEEFGGYVSENYFGRVCLAKLMIQRML